MKTYTIAKKVFINGKNRILYKKQGSCALFIKNKGSIMPYREFKRKHQPKMKGGVTDKEPLSVLDSTYYQTRNQENTGNIREHFNGMIESIFSYLSQLSELPRDNRNDRHDEYSFKTLFDIINKDGEPLAAKDHNDLRFGRQYDYKWWTGKNKSHFECMIEFPVIDSQSQEEVEIINKCYLKTEQELHKNFKTFIDKCKKHFRPKQIFEGKNPKNKRHQGIVFLYDTYYIFMGFEGYIAGLDNALSITTMHYNYKNLRIYIGISYINDILQFYILEHDRTRLNNWTKIHHEDMNFLTQQIMSEIDGTDPLTLKNKPLRGYDKEFSSRHRSHSRSPPRSKKSPSLNGIHSLPDRYLIQEIFDQAKPVFTIKELIQYLKQNLKHP